MLRQKYKAPLSIKSPEPRAKGNVDIKSGNYSKGLNKQDVNLTNRLLALRGTHPLVQEGNRRIRRKLQSKRGRRITPLPPLSQKKKA